LFDEFVRGFRLNLYLNSSRIASAPRRIKPVAGFDLNSRESIQIL
jgi:hypothetical protein